ncbi:DUF1694 domain-containing protein [Alkaliphilus peptidifermentans]|uniref:Uncharacterized protein YueI n=1 Tax=Alkaliphilus peptidifermentans DSM 18978 TaxID=1120976 RepID=A0A1G5JHE9_9FIRM|nr:DUF1694 domain-containing protein [Alkaliphilus peptidifermentans]SCY87320.1 Uncharacterized protein YueI [Alkaliphilus peptidifermentans DSM 18978]
MSEKDELQRTVEFALKGTPELKAEEKKIWLGEFRERVIMALKIEDAKLMEGLLYTEKALEDSRAEMIIVNNKIPMKIMGKYMELAKRKNKEYKTINTDSKHAMGVVIASRMAVDRENVEQEIKKLPKKFTNIRYKGLCSDCYGEIMDIDSNYGASFKKLTLIDKLMGIKCGVCENDEDGGPLM